MRDQAVSLAWALKPTSQRGAMNSGCPEISQRCSFLTYLVNLFNSGTVAAVDYHLTAVDRPEPSNLHAECTGKSSETEGAA